MERAVDWLFSHADDMDAAVAAAQGGPPSSGAGAAASFPRSVSPSVCSLSVTSSHASS